MVPSNAVFTNSKEQNMIYINTDYNRKNLPQLGVYTYVRIECLLHFNINEGRNYITIKTKTKGL